MKTTFTRIFKNGVLLASLLVSGMASAATYTAVSSGLWTSASTWAGGVSPGSSVGTLDNVVINSGVDVELDQDVEFSGILTSLEVNGTLHSSSDAYLLDMNGGVLSGDGTLTLHNLRFGATGTMTFSGESSIDKLWNSSLTLDLAADLELNDTLFLDEGTFNLASGGALSFMTSSVIRIDNGNMTVSSGVLNNSNDYSVMYVGTDKITGMELAGSGLSDVWVELDNNSQTLSITGNVTLEGTLHHNSGRIDLNGGSLTLKDDYIAASGALFIGSETSDLHIATSSSLSSTLAFDADYDELNDFSVNTSDNGGNVNLGSDLTINGALTLEDGDFTTTSGTLTMAAGSEVIVEDGHLMNSGGAFDGTAAYSVTYSGASSTWSGIELTGSGLSDLAIDLENESDSVEIMNTLTIDNELDLEHGGMAMNGYDLTLDGSLSTTSEGWFAGDDESDLTFNTTSLLNDTVWFHGTNHTFNAITINADDDSYLMIGNDLRVETINMSTGGIHMWDSELWINSTGTINGADEDRYVMIDGSGSLVMNIQVSAPYTMYPVGTDEGYAPVGLQQNSGTVGFFKVNTVNGVWSNGMTGTDLSLTGAMVDRTWDITSVNGGAVNLNMMTQWSSDFEVNGFDNTDAYIMHYTGGSWDALSQSGSAAVAVGGMFQIERQNITSLSPFAVRDGSILGIDDNAAIAVELYPNPVQDKLHYTAVFGEPTTAQVVDLAGNVLYTETVNGDGAVTNAIDFSAFPNGAYFVNYTNSLGASSYKVIKSL